MLFDACVNLSQGAAPDGLGDDVTTDRDGWLLLVLTPRTSSRNQQWPGGKV